jgi:acyl-CoA thioesterase-1
MRSRILLSSLVVIAILPRPAVGERILIVGDSLSAAYGIDPEQGWVSLLQRRLKSEGYPYDVINASISGDTTRGALERLPALLERHEPAIVVIEIGGNDGLRGIAIQEMTRNLAMLVASARDSGARVLLIPMKLPPNYGPRYVERFEQAYRTVARDEKAGLAPFLLDGIATHEPLMQEDGVHPRVEAQPQMLSNIWPALQPLL